MKTSEAYRPDIDGLRAIAVLAVILFHVNRPLLPGGFLGVDVFFVISGYLITKNILQDVNRGTFSLTEFYRRRIKRIAPVMIVVVTVTLMAAQLLQLPRDAAETTRSGVFALGSLANIYDWRVLDVSYFAADSRQLPLLHLWSLGVEEQFYLLWPAVILLGFRRRGFTLALIGTAVLSFALGDALYHRSPAFVYYMLPTRGGELLLGALTAIAVLRQIERRIAPALVPALATVAAVALAVSMFLISEHAPFPGWRAAIPTGAAAILILTGRIGANVWARLLSWKALVGVGVISYSAYLWHWPILAFLRYGYGEPGLWGGISVIALTLGLAWASYRYVEQPARRSPAPFRQVLTRQFLLPAGAVAALAGLALTHSWHSTAYAQEVMALEEQTRPAAEFVCQRPRASPELLADPKCILGTGTMRAILWGDSHAAHYVGMLATFAEQEGFRFRNIEVGWCAPLYENPTPFVPSQYLADCEASLEVVRPVVEQFPVIILSSAYLAYGHAYLPAFFMTVRTLVGKGKRVIVIGEAPWVPHYDRECREKALLYPFLVCAWPAIPLSPSVAAVNEALRTFAENTPGVSYFDATSYLCPQELCPATSPRGEPRNYDETHLTQAASTELGQTILRLGGVPLAFRLGQERPGPIQAAPPSTTRRARPLQ